MPKPLTMWITTNWKILQDMIIPDHLTCLLRNLYAAQEATVRTKHGTIDWFQIGNGVYIVTQLIYLIHRSRLEETHAVIKIAGRNIDNLKHTDDTTIMAESIKELTSPLKKVKEESEKLAQHSKFKEQ